MLTTMNGIYRMGRIEIEEQLPDIPDGSHVVVTFLEEGDIDLNSLGINQAEAGELRSRLIMFAEDWDRPEMNVYDGFSQRVAIGSSYRFRYND
ncbi:MAG: hypothetical protein HQK67_11630 [Desulfamplus sp.]|nr:hypothetical protein [Desulfamplus sp.]